ncbi:hypothetical protein VTN96DRAFT_8406 [Rasamsonia emersonii]
MFSFRNFFFSAQRVSCLHVIPSLLLLFYLGIFFSFSLLFLTGEQDCHGRIDRDFQLPYFFVFSSFFTLLIQFTRKPVHLPRATVDPGIFPEISIMSNVLRRRACTAHCAVCLLLCWLLPLCRLLQKEKLRSCKSPCPVSSLLFIPLFPIQFSSWQPEACLYFTKRPGALRTCHSKLRQASMQASFFFLFDQ